jgi:hypothetical protein
MAHVTAEMCKAKHFVLQYQTALILRIKTMTEQEE